MCLGRRKIRSVWKSGIKEGKGEHWRKSLLVGKSAKTLCLCVGVKMVLTSVLRRKRRTGRKKKILIKRTKFIILF